MAGKCTAQNRLACDRCHTQKLRCPRQERQGSCVRCARMNATCSFRPRQRRITTTSRHANSLQPCEKAADMEPDQKEVDANPNLHDMAHLDSAPVESLTTMVLDIDPSHEVPNSFMATSLTDLSSIFGFGMAELGNMFSESTHWISPLDIPWPTPVVKEPETFWPFQDHASPKVLGNTELTKSVSLASSSISTNVASSVSTPDNREIVSTAASSTTTPAAAIDIDPIHHVRTLAELNVRLYEHAAKLPSVTMVPSNMVPSMEGRLFAIDEIFGMTQSLIELLNRLYPRSGPAPDFVPDQGTILLIMSCSNRVFDIYEIIFGHMKGCIQHNVTPVTPLGETIVLPQLRIGSFSPPTPSAIAMHMLLIILMASEIFDQLREVLGYWRRNGPEKSTTNLSTSQAPNFTEEAASELTQRAYTVASNIMSTRQLLLGAVESGAGGAGGRPFLPQV